MSTWRFRQQVAQVVRAKASVRRIAEEKDGLMYHKLATMAAAAMSIQVCVEEERHVQNLGIAAAVGEKDVQKFLLDSLKLIAEGKHIQQAGMSTVSPEKKHVSTQIGTDQGADESRHWLPDTFDCVVVLRNNVTSSGRHKGHTSGIGRVCDSISASPLSNEAREIIQPQRDSKDRIAVVYEGQIANSKELWRELISGNDTNLKSETDVELIAELIGRYVEKGYSVPQATKQALSRIDGSWALIVLDKTNPEQLIVAQNGSRLCVAIGDDTMYVATEPECFAHYTNRYIALDDGEFTVIHAKDSTLDLSRTETLPFVQRTTLETDLNPAPYSHWTLSEICEQPDSLFRSLGCGSRIAGDTVVLGGMDNNASRLLGIDNLTIIGQDSLYNAAKYGELLMLALGAFNTVQAIPSGEMDESYISRVEGGACVLSRTGEARVSKAAAKIAKNSTNPVFSVVNSVGSQVARITRLGVYSNAGQENSPFTTKVFTSQIAVLALIACWFAQYKDSASKEKRLELIKELRRLPSCFSSTLESQQQCKIIAQRMFNSQHCFVLGRSFAEPIASEGALLLTKLARINAEGTSPGEFRHIDLSLIQGSKSDSNRTPVIVIILSGDEAEYMRHIASQARSRGAYTIVITDDEKLAEGVSDVTLPIPKNGLLTAMNAIVPLQLIAYELALLKGIDPDKGLDKFHLFDEN